MQHPEFANSPKRQIRQGRIAVILSLILTFAVGGCGPESTAANDRPPKPYANVSLKVYCSDKPFADAVTPIAKIWAARTGAGVEIVTGSAEQADVLIIPTNEIGVWAERGELQPVPGAIREVGHAFQWGNVLSAYRSEQLTGWGGQIVALPLAGSGHVLVYRKDRFEDPIVAYLWQLEKNQELAAPTTWEDYAALTELFSRLDGKPILTPLPADEERLADLYFRIAASFDRLTFGETMATVPPGEDPLAFQFHTTTGKPRLNTGAFLEAATWLSTWKKTNALPEGGDPAEAMAEGRAVMGILSLDELARIRKGREWTPDRFGVASLPGSRAYYNDKGRKQPIASGNFIPYFSGGRFGVVRKSCSRHDAAFDLLAELGGPQRSLEIISNTALGAGPFRASHLDRDRLLIWLGYGFDEEGSKSLQEALRTNVGQAVRNPVFGLRGPDQAKLTRALAAELKSIGNGSASPEVALNRAISAWESLDAAVPAEQLRLWRRRALGLN